MKPIERGNEYIDAVLSGKVRANKWIKLLAQMHRDDMAKIADDDFPFTFDESKVNRMVKFIENLRHVKGKFNGKRIILEPWQIFAACFPFGWIRKDNGRRRFREIFLMVCRKNGKSLLAACIALYMFCADGEAGAEVFSGATTEKQAWEVFRPAHQIASRQEEFRDYYEINVGAKALTLADGSRLEPIIGKPGDGSSPSCSVIDEYHEHADSSMYDTMETGMGARENPIILVISTAGDSIGGPCHQHVQEAQESLLGIRINPVMWPVLYGLEESDDWTDPENLILGNPNLGVSLDRDYLLAQLDLARGNPARQSVFRTKHCNEWVGAKTAWLDIIRWNMAPPRPPIEEFTGRQCILALDLSSKIDLSALLYVFPPLESEGVYAVYGKFFLPEARANKGTDTFSKQYRAWSLSGDLILTPGEVIDFATIRDVILEDAARFDILELAYDPWQATQFATELMGAGLPVIEIRQTVRNFSEPMKAIEALVAQKRIAHGNDPVLRWCMANVTAKRDSKDNIYPNKAQAANKIDGAVALIMAMNRALLINSNEVDMLINGSIKG